MGAHRPQIWALNVDELIVIGIQKCLAMVDLCNVMLDVFAWIVSVDKD